MKITFLFPFIHRFPSLFVLLGLVGCLSACIGRDQEVVPFTDQQLEFMLTGGVIEKPWLRREWLRNGEAVSGDSCQQVKIILLLPSNELLEGTYGFFGTDGNCLLNENSYQAGEWRFQRFGESQRGELSFEPGEGFTIPVTVWEVDSLTPSFLNLRLEINGVQWEERYQPVDIESLE